jgi:16S rRNA (cytosine967-C5)-methyltransferase
LNKTTCLSKFNSAGDRDLDVRVAASQVLTAVLRDCQSLTQALSKIADRVTERDRGLLQELCFGVARYTPAYEVLAKTLLSTPIKTKELQVKALLFIGFYQLEHTRIPDHAAINSVVEASKILNKRWATGLLNGVLRRFCREHNELATHLEEQLSYRYAHPDWLINMLRKAWPDNWQDILINNNVHPPLTLRINQRLISRQAYSADLHLEHRLGNFSSQAITLESAADVVTLPGYQQGWFAVQDEAAQLCAELLQLSPGQRVLDACCAPGGKSCHILEHQSALTELVAIDCDSQRMERVAQNMLRLGLEANLIVADAADTGAWWDGRYFDRILLDAPCSATGVIRRHPDIKILRHADDIVKLANLQQQLLAALWPTLAPGGILLYATCSVLPHENEKSIQHFLTRVTDAVHVPIDDVKWGVARPLGRQLFPQSQGHDGFYYCVLRKKT